MDRKLSREELFNFIKEVNPDKILDFIYKTKDFLKDYIYESDNNFVISGRRRYLIIEAKGILNNEDEYCKGNCLKGINDKANFVGKNILELSYCDSYPYNTDENGNPIDGHEQTKLRDKDKAYSDKGIVSLEEKNIIEELLNDLEKFYTGKNIQQIIDIKKRNLDKIADYRKHLYEKPQLKDLFLEVTMRCNARCEHCGSSCGDKALNDEISAEDLKKALHDIAEKYNPQEVLLNVTGGEPLVRKDLFEIMEYAVSLGFRWGMTSNGMLINDEILKKMEETKMETISISLDGLKETHESFRKVPNCFDRIIENIKKLQKVPTIKIVQITTVANKKNLKELEKLYKLMQELNIISWRVINVDPIGRAKENKDILLDSNDYVYLWNFIKEKREENKLNVEYGCSHYLDIDYEKELRDTYFICSAGLFVGSILSNGDITVCPNVERRPEFVQGNIKNDNFVEVWENRFKLFRNDDRLKCEKCKNCSKWKYCLGDSFHTFNFDDKKPNFCIKDIIKERN